MPKGMLYVNDIPNFVESTAAIDPGLGVGGARTNPPSVSPLLVETERDNVGVSTLKQEERSGVLTSRNKLRIIIFIDVCFLVRIMSTRP